MRAGRSFTTNGPLIAAFRVDGARMGELVSAPDGEVTLELAVAAAPWVPVEEVRVLVNGEIARRITGLAGPESPLRLQLSEPLRLAGDAFVTVEAGAPLDTERERWRRAASTRTSTRPSSAASRLRCEEEGFMWGNQGRSASRPYTPTPPFPRFLMGSAAGAKESSGEDV